MSAALTLFELRADGDVSSLPSYVSQSEGKKAELPKENIRRRDGLAFYRKYTEAMLRRYMRLSMRVGRMPSLLGQDIFRGKTSTYRISSFEDAVIFVHDMEKCLERLDSFSQQLITRIALQEYTQGEASHLLGVSLRTIVRRYGETLDELTEVLLDRKLMTIQMHVSETVAGGERNDATQK